MQEVLIAVSVGCMVFIFLSWRDWNRLRKENEVLRALLKENRRRSFAEGIVMWQEIESFKSFEPRFESITTSELWRGEIEPWFKRMLWEISQRLIIEHDVEAVRVLQVKAHMIQGWLAEPERFRIMVEAKKQNQDAQAQDDEEELDGRRRKTRY